MIITIAGVSRIAAIAGPVIGPPAPGVGSGVALGIALRASCGLRCWSARGPVCRCPCGGENHGAILPGRDKLRAWDGSRSIQTVMWRTPAAWTQRTGNPNPEVSRMDRKSEPGEFESRNEGAADRDILDGAPEPDDPDHEPVIPMFGWPNSASVSGRVIAQVVNRILSGAGGGQPADDNGVDGNGVDETGLDESWLETAVPGLRQAVLRAISEHDLPESLLRQLDQEIDICAGAAASSLSAAQAQDLRDAVAERMRMQQPWREPPGRMGEEAAMIQEGRRSR